MGSGGRDPIGSRGKVPGGRLWEGGFAPDADDTFFETMIFCHGFKNDIPVAIFLYSLPTSVQYEMEEKKSIWRQKSGRASNSAACLLGTKMGWPCP